MKVLFCQACGDIVAPIPVANMPRWCRCGRHACWWVDPHAGVFRAFDRDGRDGQPREAKAFVLGLTNSWLNAPWEHLSAKDYQDIIDSHEDNYLFKQLRSVAIRMRPGESGDTRWANLPHLTINNKDQPPEDSK